MSKVNVETILHDRIDTVSAKLESATPGSPEHKALAAELDGLMGRAIEMEKADHECEDKIAEREDEKKDRLVRNIMTGAGIVLPLVVTIWGTKVSLKFEEEGTITTQMGRGFLQRLFPKK